MPSSAAAYILGMDELAAIWPLSALRIHTGDLEVRVPDEADLVALATLALDDIHNPDTMPFLTPWTDQPPLERARGVLQWNWRMRAEWNRDKWALPLVAVRDGQVVGTQGIDGHHFASTREVDTGSWVGQKFQNQGVGTAMRRAVLHLAFDGLGAETARSGAFADNATSLRVSEKLGYIRDGTEVHERRGERAEVVRLVLPRRRWIELSAGWPEVSIQGLEPALEMFGLG